MIDNYSTNLVFKNWFTTDELGIFFGLYKKLSSKEYNFFHKNEYLPLSQDRVFMPLKDKEILSFVINFESDFKNAEREIFASLSWFGLNIGELTAVEDIVTGLIEKTSVPDVSAWLTDLCLKNSSNELLLCTIMHALSHLEYEMVYPAGPSIAVSMISHIDKMVVSYAIKAFSNWNCKDSLKYMKNYKPRDKWAQQEWNRVMRYIEENGDEINGIPYENDSSVSLDTKSA